MFGNRYNEYFAHDTHSACQKIKEKWPNHKLSSATSNHHELVNIFVNGSTYENIGNLLIRDTDYNALAELIREFVSHLEQDEYLMHDIKLLQQLIDFVIALEFKPKFKKQISDINYYLGMYLYNNQGGIFSEPTTAPLLMLLLSHYERPEQQQASIKLFLTYFFQGITTTGGEQTPEHKQLQQQLLDALIDQVLSREIPAMLCFKLITELFEADGNRYQDLYQLIQLSHEKNGTVSIRFVELLKQNLNNLKTDSAQEKVTLFNHTLKQYYLEIYSLHKLAKDTSAEVMEIMIRFMQQERVQPDINAEFAGLTPLHYAAESKEDADAKVNVLITAGADPSVLSSNSTTPLYCAVDAGNTDAIRRLLTIPHININTVSHTGLIAFHQVIIPSNRFSQADTINLAKAFLQHQSLDMTQIDPIENLDSFQLALKYGQTEIANLFTEEPVKSRYTTALIQQQKPIALARFLEWIYKQLPNKEILLQLDICKQSMSMGELQTLFSILLEKITSDALNNNRYIIINRILNHTPKLVNTVFLDGSSLLARAIQAESAPMALNLLTQGADPNLPTNDKTPLENAISKIDIVELLIHHGADTSVLSQSGHTLFIEAVAKQSFSVATKLLRTNPDFFFETFSTMSTTEKMKHLNSLIAYRNHLELQNETDITIRLQNALYEITTSTEFFALVSTAIYDNDIAQLKIISELGNIDFYREIRSESKPYFIDYGRSYVFRAILKGQHDLADFLVQHHKDSEASKVMQQDAIDAEQFIESMHAIKNELNNKLVQLTCIQRCSKQKRPHLEQFQLEARKILASQHTGNRFFSITLPEQAEEFLLQLTTLIEKYEQDLTQHHGHLYILPNILLCLTVIGAIALAIKAIHSKVTTGHAQAFFKSSKVANRFIALKQTVETIPSPYAHEPERATMS